MGTKPIFILRHPVARHICRATKNPIAGFISTRYLVTGVQLRLYIRNIKSRLWPKRTLSQGADYTAFFRICAMAQSRVCGPASTGAGARLAALFGSNLVVNQSRNLSIPGRPRVLSCAITGLAWDAIPFLANR